MENWKKIPDYENYEVSDFGRVRNVKTNRILKLRLVGSGYYSVNLSKNGSVGEFRVNRLVYYVFKGVWSDRKNVIDHIDNDKLNNRLSNLRLVSARENTNKKHLRSSSKYVGVSWCKTQEKWRAYIHINGKNKYLGSFNNEYDAHLAYQSKLKEISI